MLNPQLCLVLQLLQGSLEDHSRQRWLPLLQHQQLLQCVGRERGQDGRELLAWDCLDGVHSTHAAGRGAETQLARAAWCCTHSW
jgi:hypothetical protein